MVHPLTEKWARLLTAYCAEVQAGEVVSVNIDAAAEPLARAVYREVLRAGGVPLLHMNYPEILADTLELGSDASFERSASLELRELEQVDAWIRVRAPQNTRALQSSDKSKYSRYTRARRPAQSYRVNNTKWVGSLYPTDALAQDAGMSLADYEQFVYGAMYLFDDDPVAKWLELHDFQAQLIARLRDADEVHIKADGTDLKLRVGGRVWKNSDGHRNMPSGEVFTGPVEDSANGVISYTIPSSVNGVGVENMRLVFKDGKVIEASAEKGNDLLQAQLETDAGARFLGELGIGTNYNIQTPTGQILYDEKIGGTVHLAIGQSYTDTGGTNESAVHWDMICDLRQGGAIYLDGELFQENGEFNL